MVPHLHPPLPALPHLRGRRVPRRLLRFQEQPLYLAVPVALLPLLLAALPILLEHIQNRRRAPVEPPGRRRFWRFRCAEEDSVAPVECDFTADVPIRATFCILMIVGRGTGGRRCGGEEVLAGSLLVEGLPGGLGLDVADWARLLLVE